MKKLFLLVYFGFVALTSNTHNMPDILESLLLEEI